MAKKVFLVDDHEVVRKGIGSLIKSMPGFEVVGETGSSLDSADLIVQLNPDIIVLDIEMPGKNGIEVAREIARIAPEALIIALSMHSEKKYVSEMFAAGARGYVLKDEAVDEFERALNAVSNGKKYLSPSLVDIVMNQVYEDNPASKSNLFAKLTNREKEILIYLADGYSTKEIAYELQLSTKTVDTHRQQILKKLEMDNLIELTKFAIKEGLIDL